jgi:hypothetical protein
MLPIVLDQPEVAAEEVVSEAEVEELLWHLYVNLIVFLQELHN